MQPIHVEMSSSATVVPEIGVDKLHHDPTNTTIKQENVALVTRSKNRQFSALMRKHYSAYKRDTELLGSEIFMLLLYTVLLICFSLTAFTQISHSETYSDATVNATSSVSAAFQIPFASFNDINYTSACDGHDCFLAFGDVDHGSGCSDHLDKLLRRMPVCNVWRERPYLSSLGCQDPTKCQGATACFSTAGCAARDSTGSWSGAFSSCNAGAAGCTPCFPSATEECRRPPDTLNPSTKSNSPTASTTVSDIFTNYTGIRIPRCQCFPTSQYHNYSFIQEQHIVAAVRFEPGFSNETGYNYTMYLSGPKVSHGLSKFKSPLRRGGTSYAQSEQFKSAALQLQVAIDSAITGHDIAVQVGRFPTARIETWNAGALGNIPLYLNFMIFVGLQSFAGQLAEEGEKGLRQALFMVGLDPLVYWMSWVTILIGKLFLTSTLIFIILGIVMPHFHFFGTALPFLLICSWSIQLCILLGLLGVGSKTAQTVVGFLPPALSVIPTVVAFASTSNDGLSDGVLIPGWVHITFGALGPPYAFSIVLAEMLFRTNSLEGGLRLEEYAKVGKTGVSPLQMVLCLVAGNVLLFLINWFLSSANRGIATSARKSDGGSSGQNDQGEPQEELQGEDDGVAVSIHGLCKQWGSLSAVDGLSVDFMDNQITGFLGHNGAGKSTTIKLLTGLYNVTSGDATVYGKSVAKEMGSVRQMIGVCPQDNIFWNKLTVLEHMELLADIRGVQPDLVEEHIEVLLKDVGLLKSKGNLGSSLSGGMKRKMCVCMALIGDPKVLFLDEPTAGMDSGARRDVWKLLLRKRVGRCIVLCTHYMEEADILSDRIAVINEGKLQDVGTPTELKLKYGKNIHLEISVSQGCDRRDVLQGVDQALRNAKEAAAKEGGANEGGANEGGANEGAAAKIEIFDDGCQVDEGIVRLDMSDHVGDVASLEKIENDILDASDAADLTLLLPIDVDVAVVMEELERVVNTDDSKVENYGIVAATLSDVFWELDQEAGRKSAEREEEKEVLKGIDGVAKEPTLNELVRKTSKPPCCVKVIEIIKQRKTSLLRRTWGCPLPCGCRIPVLLQEMFFVRS